MRIHLPFVQNVKIKSTLVDYFLLTNLPIKEEVSFIRVEQNIFLICQPLKIDRSKPFKSKDYST